jgi:AraC-like DNA-binding protein
MVHEFTALSCGRSHAAFREAILWQLLLRRERSALEKPATPQERIRRLAGRIRENAGGKWEVEALAREAGLSPGHFRRVFCSVTGRSPFQFVLDCRIQRACYYLRETRLPVGEIAAATGYGNVFHFSRQFKDRTGMNPSCWRRRHPGAVAYIFR